MHTHHAGAAPDLPSGTPPPFAALAGRLSGRVVTPGDCTWDDARRAWSLGVDQRPAAVVQAADAEDVAHAVRFAADRGMRVAAQCTGHNAGPLADRLDGTLLLRTSAMRGVSVDPEARLAHVQAGALWADVVQAAAPHGLAPLAGSSPDVGVVGYLLGGGLSWLARKHGLACNDVVAMDVVTADGSRRHVDAEHDSGLFWALRGGGGDVAVVTSLTLRLHPVPDLVAGALFFPLERAAGVLHTWLAWTGTVPDEVTSCARLLRLPDLPELPPALRGGAFAVVEVAVLGSPRLADDVLEPLRFLGPVLDTVTSCGPQDLLRLHMDPEHPVPCAGEGALLRRLPVAGVEALLDAAGPGADCPLLSVEVRHLGGAVGRPRPGGGVTSHLDADLALFAVGVTPDPAAERVVRAGVDRVLAAVAPWDAGRGFRNFTESSWPVARFHLPGDAEGLRWTKVHYDPSGVFVANHPSV